MTNKHGKRIGKWEEREAVGGFGLQKENDDL